MASATTAQPKSGKTWTEVNRDHFDAMADSAFQAPWIRQLHQDVIHFLAENRPWLGIPADGSAFRVLDFACGNGILSIALAPSVTALRGIDISPAMVQRYNEAAAKHGYSTERMRAVEADILGSNPSAAAAAAGGEFAGFQLAMISMALHHIDDAVATLKTLADRLAPGGRLLVIDWCVSESPDGHDRKDGHEHTHDHAHAHDHTHNHAHAQAHAHVHEPSELAEAARAVKTVVHHGFTKQQMLDMFEAAGLADGDFRMSPTPTELPANFGGKGYVFYALGRKM